ncbi:immunity 49 family protein [Streptomyces spiramyceticus]|uniref:immunity 49 family protein n=1 Tax=Streptomyces spiramyceticus TaxID=299717 RepID=UPI00237C035F|nr:immunity 49 family protein [Streptomyces spiramyceticus]
MAVIVTRHEFDTTKSARHEEVLHTILHRRIDELEESPRLGFGEELSAAMSSAVSEASCRCALDPTASKVETWEAFVTAMQLGSALFASATATGDSVQCRIAHKMRTIPATGAHSFTDASTWIDAFWLAIIGRDQDRMNQLCNVPISLLRDSGAVYDEYIYAWVDALQTYWRREPGLVDKLEAAIAGTEPDVLAESSKDYVLEVMYPPINLFYRFLLQDHAQFNADLAQALEWHKGHWSEDEDQASRVSGLVALGPLAITCLAFDGGFPIEVESDYLPHGLVDRGWLGEFDT